MPVANIPLVYEVPASQEGRDDRSRAIPILTLHSIFIIFFLAVERIIRLFIFINWIAPVTF